MTNESESLLKAKALADVATGEDKLFRDGFVKGVSEFIKKCPTPMTIAIQGDCGTGKTSLINLIEKELRAETPFDEDYDSLASKYCEDIVCAITVDVWKQSAANPGIGPFQIFLGEMGAQLSGTSLSEMKNASGFATVVTSVLGSVDSGGNGDKDDSPFASILDTLFGGEDEKKAESEGDFITSEDISSFQTSIVDSLKRNREDFDKSEYSRFVVFVDGLDCISSEAAFDLMERVKTYLDCPGCVFVFAVDEKVVFDGVRKKFGDKVDEGRKKMFFDRFVQVPLRIPADAYNLDKYVKDFLLDEEELSGELAEVIKALVNEPTPRRVKRHISTMYLYRSVFGGPEDGGDGSLAMLLAAVILKAESAQGFDVVAKCAKGDDSQFTENLKAKLESSNLDDGINWETLPALWAGGEGACEDVARRSAFLFWIQKLK